MEEYAEIVSQDIGATTYVSREFYQFAAGKLTMAIFKSNLKATTTLPLRAKLRIIAHFRCNTPAHALNVKRSSTTGPNRERGRLYSLPGEGVSSCKRPKEMSFPQSRQGRERLRVLPVEKIVRIVVVPTSRAISFRRRCEHGPDLCR